eukprot:GCRY01001218.1.p1 GENE.GCRY01001218.1~~GCRY01001218.1.p1  ORF type:complete len:145 (-),score=9.71 GCRY01001218.1:328-762(-)
MSCIIFEDMFEITDINPQGKKFDRVSRVIGRTENYEMDLILDINTDIYPVDIADKFSFALASTLKLDGSPDDGSYDPTDNHKNLSDDYQYVMHGKIFKFDKESSSSRLVVYISFGGLLLILKSEPRNLQGLDLDSRIYFLMRRI